MAEVGTPTPYGLVKLNQMAAIKQQQNLPPIMGVSAKL